MKPDPTAKRKGAKVRAVTLPEVIAHAVSHHRGARGTMIAATKKARKAAIR
jgi:hypothetical protein